MGQTAGPAHVCSGLELQTSPGLSPQWREAGLGCRPSSGAQMGSVPRGAVYTSSVHWDKSLASLGLCLFFCKMETSHSVLHL